MGNQQLYNLNNNQLQTILSGILGDGHIAKHSPYFSTSCKYEEYIDYKITLLGNLWKNKSFNLKNGYAQTPIYLLRTRSVQLLKNFKELNLKEILSKLDNLGIALWFYDDGSLHKDKLFYNLNTHSFSKKEQELYFLPFFNKLNIYPKITKEKKKNGNTYYYLRISKFEGAYEISKILNKYKINCYKYKLWSSEASQKWRKLQVKLKHEGIKFCSNKLKGVILSNLDNPKKIQDMVRSARKRAAAY